jgi:hypothetical protein
MQTADAGDRRARRRRGGRELRVVPAHTALGSGDGPGQATRMVPLQAPERLPRRPLAMPGAA